MKVTKKECKHIDQIESNFQINRAKGFIFLKEKLTKNIVHTINDISRWSEEDKKKYLALSEDYSKWEEIN